MIKTQIYEPVYEFSVFHLAKVDSLLETAKIEIEEV